jgi:Dockerin type I domain/Putative peptidoglycan binding domain
MKKYTLFAVFVFLAFIFNVPTGFSVIPQAHATDNVQDEIDAQAVSTFNSLYKSTFRVGMKKSNDVLFLQKFLKDQDYYFGKADGKYGKITARAVKDFADDNDITLNTAVVTTSTQSTTQPRLCPLGTSVTLIDPNNCKPIATDEIKTPKIISISQSSGVIGSPLTFYGSGFSSLNSSNYLTNDQFGVWFSNGQYSARVIGNEQNVNLNDNSFSFVIPSTVCPGKESATCSSNFSVSTPPGVYSVYLRGLQGSSNPINFVVSGNSIIKSTLIYDVNGDGQVTVADQQKLYNVVMGIDNVSAKSCDLNNDGQINIADLQLMINYLSGYTNPPVQGSTLVISAALNVKSSTMSQFIPVGSDGASNKTTAVYAFAPVGNASVTITEVKFSVNGANTINSIRFSDKTVAVVNGIAWFTGLSIPVQSPGMDVYAYPSYSGVGVNGVPSGSPSNIALEYVKYQNVNTSTTSTWCTGAMGSCTMVMTTGGIQSPVMILVGSKPTLQLVPSTANLTTGLVDIGHIVVSAGVNGNVKINTLPIVINAFNVNLVANSAFTLQDSNGTQIPAMFTVNQVNGGSVLVNINNGYVVPAGSSSTFKILAKVDSINGNASIALSLDKPGLFSWTDTAGSSSSEISSSNSAYFYNYPTNSVSIGGTGVVVPAQSITVLSPNGGETYKVGDTVSIKWRASGQTSANNSVGITIRDAAAFPYKIFLTQYGSNSVVNGQVSDSGVSSWTIPVNTPAGKYILYMNTSTGWDESDSSFSITQ